MSKVQPISFSELDFNDEFVASFDALENTSDHIFLTGKAGTGKSTLLQYFRHKTTKNIAVLAPTGVAAINIKGQTIHSFFQFKPDITPEAVNDAMTGRVLYAFAPGPNAIPLAKAGKLQILVTTSPAGARFMAGVPSLAEAGVAGYEGDDWFGVFAPAGTPLAMRETMAKEMARALAQPAVRERLVALGAEPAHLGPAEFDAMVRTYLASTRKLGD